MSFSTGASVLETGAVTGTLNTCIIQNNQFHCTKIPAKVPARSFWSYWLSFLNQKKTFNNLSRKMKCEFQYWSFSSGDWSRLLFSCTLNTCIIQNNQFHCTKILAKVPARSYLFLELLIWLFKPEKPFIHWKSSWDWSWKLENSKWASVLELQRLRSVFMYFKHLHHPK